MATKAKINHNKKRIALVDRHRAKRVELRARAKDLKLSPEERVDAVRALTALPRNSAENRVRNRCELTGRSRGFLRKFKLSRIKFRELALIGHLPGVTKSSW